MAPAVLESLDQNITNLDLVVSATKAGGSTGSVSFGGDDLDQWLYNPETKQFDLSRGSTKKLQIEADDGIRNHRGVLIDPEKTVLVVIDMQNYFIVSPLFRSKWFSGLLVPLQHPECCHHPGTLGDSQRIVHVHWTDSI